MEESDAVGEEDEEGAEEGEDEPEASAADEEVAGKLDYHQQRMYDLIFSPGAKRSIRPLCGQLAGQLATAVINLAKLTFQISKFIMKCINGSIFGQIQNDIASIMKEAAQAMQNMAAGDVGQLRNVNVGFNPYEAITKVKNICKRLMQMPKDVTRLKATFSMLFDILKTMFGAPRRRRHLPPPPHRHHVGVVVVPPPPQPPPPPPPPPPCAIAEAPLHDHRLLAAM